MYLAQNKLPFHKATTRRTETFAERYLLLYPLLFRLNTSTGKESAVLAIPESCVDKIITLYHFWRTLQLCRNEKPQPRQLHHRINLNCKPINRFSMGWKVMPQSYEEDTFILVVIDKVTNFMKTMLINQSTLEEIGNASIEYVFSRYCILKSMIMGQDIAFMSTLINYLFKRLGIKFQTLAPYNHSSIQSEHGIKSLATILIKI